MAGAQPGKRLVRGMAALIVRTRQINQVLGTNLGPWDLGDLPDEWLTALEMWIDGAPAVESFQEQMAAALARVRGKGQRRQ